MRVIKPLPVLQEEEGMKAQEGTWRLIAPDGREWHGKSPLQCATKEIESRLSPQQRFDNLMKTLENLPDRVILSEPCAKCGGTEYYCADCLDG